MSSAVSLVIFPDLSSNHRVDETGAFTNAEANKSFAFDEQSIRKGFIRKVYLMLMCQLLITFGFVCVFSSLKSSQNWVQQNPALVWITLAVLIVTMIYMAHCESVRRKAPQNLIFLLLFTLAESFLLGMIAVQYEADWVLMTVGITAAVALGLTLFALQTKWDFATCSGVVVACLVVFVIFGIVAILYPSRVITLLYSSLGVILFSVYLVKDTQLMMGCNHKYSISPEEHIFAALNLYLDIVNIFMYILTIIGCPAVRRCRADLHCFYCGFGDM